MDELLKLHYTDLTQKDLQEFKKINYEDEMPKIKPSFNLKAFMFGAFYLLYRKLYLEGVAVIILSLLLFRVSPIVGVLSFFIISGIFYYFLYTNKFKKDLDSCGYPLTDKEKLKELGGTSVKAVVGTLIFSILLFMPMIITAIYN
jgi:hypothetical protein